MPKLEVFYDYSCPYCLKGHDSLVELIGDYPDIQIDWKPCEAHPEPEPGPHSDLTLQGTLFALEHGADIWAYHRKMYEALLKDKIDRENIDALANYMKDIVNAEDFCQALKSGKYKKVQMAINDYAYEESGVWAVPSYRFGDKKLDAVEGVGVTTEQLRKFFDDCK